MLDIDFNKNLSQNEIFLQTRIVKEKYSIDKLCNGNAKILNNFAKNIFLLRFNDEPDYTLLRNILQSHCVSTKI